MTIKFIPCRKKNADRLVPFINFLEVMHHVDDEIKNEELSYLIKVVQKGKNSIDLEDDNRFQFLKKFSLANFILNSSKLPLLESIEEHSDCRFC